MRTREGQLLRIFVGEDDRHEHLPVYEWIVRRARELGLAGATVLRGLEGFGSKKHLHTARILRLSTDQAILVEIVDSREKLEAFLPTLEEAVSDGLVTLERVEVLLHRSRS